MSLRVGPRRYRLEDQLGAGAFGEIYAGVDVKSEQPVAIKLEHVSAEHPQLAYEARVYKQLRASGMTRVPELYYSGKEGNYNVLVLQKLDENLESMLTSHRRQLPMTTTLQFADQMLTLLEQVHDQGFIHRDIKPENFMVQHTAGSSHTVNVPHLYIIDFGLSKCFWNPQTDEHIPFRSDKHLTGTARYASVNNHKGFEQSRRDDLESLGYVLIYLIKGRLPWQNQPGASRKEKYAKMQVMKEQAVRDRSLFQSLPAAFSRYFDYVQNLKFDDRPDYVFLRSLFKRELRQAVGGGSGAQQSAYDVAASTCTRTSGVSTASGATDASNATDASDDEKVGR